LEYQSQLFSFGKAFKDELTNEISELKLHSPILRHITEGTGEVSLKVNETTKYLYTRTCYFVCNTEK
jgi:hypothetical protein